MHMDTDGIENRVLAGRKGKYRGFALGLVAAGVSVLAGGLGLGHIGADRFDAGGGATTQGFASRSSDPEAQSLEQRLLTQIAPILENNCISCHGPRRPKGGVSLSEYDALEFALEDLETLLIARNRVSTHEMPPPGEPQPTDEERRLLLDWIDDLRRHAQQGQSTDPGWFSTRRLNRDEYRNTLRDLLGIDPKRHDLAERFPADDLGYGFNTIGDVLTVSTLHLETYLASAEEAIELALGPVAEVSTKPRRLSPLEGQGGGRPLDSGGYYLFSNGFARALTNIAVTADHEIRIRAWGDQGGDELPRLSLRVDGREIAAFFVEAQRGEPAQEFSVVTTLGAGPREITGHFTNDFFIRGEADRNLAIESIALAGPLSTATIKRPPVWKQIFFVDPPNEPEAQRAAARKILERFADRAFRRPITEEEVDRLVALYDQARSDGDGYETAIRLGLEAVLVSPSFHFLTSPDESTESSADIRPLSNHALASRLSYFLWSSMPDAELRRLADLGLLQDERVLLSQVQRMLADRKADAFIESFAGQWLLLRNLEAVDIDRERFNAYDEELRDDMIAEVTLFFADLVRANRSIMHIIDAEDVFLNERLASHYGVDGVRGDAFRRVRLDEDSSRGGVLTMGAVLTVTSNPTRTSPVKRGLFVLDQVLGTPPPPPPPEIPPLEQTQVTLGENATIREQMAAHLIDSTCASCHVRMDPIGLAMEHFDAIGRWRMEADGHPVDASGVLPGGISFNGPDELKKILLAQDEQVVENVTRRLMTYAIGRGLESFDRPTVDAVVAKVRTRGDGFADLIEAVVLSDAFRMSRARTERVGSE